MNKNLQNNRKKIKFGNMTTMTDHISIIQTLKSTIIVPDDTTNGKYNLNQKAECYEIHRLRYNYLHMWIKLHIYNLVLLRIVL